MRSRTRNDSTRRFTGLQHEVNVILKMYVDIMYVYINSLYIML